MDVHSTQTRSFNMSKIRSGNTKPETKFRKALWASGLKNYRVSPKKIYGKPDIFFSKYKIAIFIDGCFWHMCKKCYIEPANNKAFWINKLNLNIKRDDEVNRKLEESGIMVIRLWEHEIKQSLPDCLLKINKLVKPQY